jgi:hypothetical protein
MTKQMKCGTKSADRSLIHRRSFRPRAHHRIEDMNAEEEFSECY